MNKEKILTALSKLDAENDNHWTTDGKPKLETIAFLSAGEKISRAELDELAPDFSRTNTSVVTDGGKVEVTMEQVQERNEEIKDAVEQGESVEPKPEMVPGDALNPTASSPVVGVDQLLGTDTKDDVDTSTVNNPLKAGDPGTGEVPDTKEKEKELAEQAKFVAKVEVKFDQVVETLLGESIPTDLDVTTLSDEELDKLVDKTVDIQSSIAQAQASLAQAIRNKMAVVDRAIVERETRKGGKQHLHETIQAFHKSQSQLEAPAPTARQNYVNPIDDPATRQRRR